MERMKRILLHTFVFYINHFCVLIFPGIDEKGPQLFHMDPSGTFVQYDAKAIGSGSEGAQQSLKVIIVNTFVLKPTV